MSRYSGVGVADESKPIATCTTASCRDCSLPGRLVCHFRPAHFLRFILAVLPGFIAGALGIARYRQDLLFLWIGFCVVFFGLIEIRVLCAHCPHYAESGRLLTCWANHGSPKLWRYRPGPLSIVEKVILLGGFGLIWGYPLPPLLLQESWLLLLVYLAASAGFWVILQMGFCTRCINLNCPLNRVDAQVRREFLRRNPGVTGN